MAGELEHKLPFSGNRMAPKVATKAQIHEEIRAIWPEARGRFDKLMKAEYGDFLVEEAELSHKGEWVIQQRVKGRLVGIKFTIAVDSLVTVIPDRRESQN